MTDEQQPTLRLAVLSEVALAAPDAPPRPIHALRAGTFTDMRGREVTFEPADLALIAERLNAAAARRKPPINEGHNFGRAVGRLTGASATGEALYLTPKWNSDGRRLLSEEVYDGFSIELQAHAEGGWYAVGGALTNYPAVSDLQPVTLSAPPLPPEPIPAPPTLPAPPAPVDTTPALTQEITPMSDEPTQAQAAPEPPAPPVNLSNDPAITAQITAYASEQRAWFLEQMEAVRAQAQAEARALFEQQQAEQRREQAVVAFAQHVTTPTLARPHALPFRAEQVAEALRPLNDAQRAPVEALLRQVVESGLVAYDRIGGGGGEEQRDKAEQYRAAVLAKTATGMSEFEAIRAVNREHPDLYLAQQQPKGGN